MQWGAQQCRMLETNTEILDDGENLIENDPIVNEVGDFFCGELISQIWQFVRDIPLAVNKDLAEMDSHVQEKCPNNLAISPCVVVDENRVLLFHIRIFYNF